jgi:carboxypeptidase C (cathepsin A)
MEGGFQESGPLWTAPGGAGLQLNAYSWNKFSTQVFLEAPAGVGFSYADTPAGTRHNDTSTAADNLEAINAFYLKFPEFSQLPLWLTGER